MKALIVDAEEVFRLSMREIVSVAAPFDDILEATNQTEFLSITSREPAISLVIFHAASLWGDITDWTALVKRLYPRCAILHITDGAPTALPQAGHTISRSSSVNKLVLAIRQAMNLSTGGFGAVSPRPERPHVWDAVNRARLSESSQSRISTGSEVVLNRLSSRQREILAMAADGLPNKEIAARLEIAEGTVKAHMHAIFKVMGASNRTQAVLKYAAVGGQPASLSEPGEHDISDACRAAGRTPGSAAGNWLGRTAPTVAQQVTQIG